MRTIHDHKVNPANDTLTVIVTDEPGSGGASHRYEVTGFEPGRNASANRSTQARWKQDQQPTANAEILLERAQRAPETLVILFQNGPIPECGVNGITQEVLLAIVADRLRSFQQGPFACKANACALTHIEEAQHWLQQRTIERMRRGVEGTHTV